jgi:uncharacterized membrane protein YhaH (DUF805 family)
VVIAGVACDDAGMSPPSISTTASTTPAGIKPAPFIFAVFLIYVASFVSQMLLSQPVTSRMSVVPFVLAQVVLIGLWIVLHRRRLNDAGRPWGTVIGIAMVYALEIALLVILMAFIVSVNAAGDGGASGDNSVLNLFVIFYLMALFSGDTGFGGLQIWLIGFVAVMLLPVAIAVCFSIWAATRPSKTPAVS